MKCSRCGETKGIIVETEIVIPKERLTKKVILCEKCLDELATFVEGRKLCGCSNSYMSAMYNEPVYEEEKQ